MSIQLMIPPMDPLTYSVFRNALIHELESQTAEQIENATLDLIQDWQAVEDAGRRRSVKHLAILLKEGELRSLIKNSFTYFRPFADVDDTTDIEFEGGQGWEEALAIGILASLIACALWDAFGPGPPPPPPPIDPNCVSIVKEYIQGDCFQWCVNALGEKDGEPWPCESGSR